MFSNQKNDYVFLDENTESLFSTEPLKKIANTNNMEDGYKMEKEHISLEELKSYEEVTVDGKKVFISNGEIMRICLPTNIESNDAEPQIVLTVEVTDYQMMGELDGILQIEINLDDWLHSFVVCFEEKLVEESLNLEDLRRKLKVIDKMRTVNLDGAIEFLFDHSIWNNELAEYSIEDYYSLLNSSTHFEKLQEITYLKKDRLLNNLELLNALQKTFLYDNGQVIDVNRNLIAKYFNTFKDNITSIFTGRTIDITLSSNGDCFTSDLIFCIDSIDVY